MPLWGLIVLTVVALLAGLAAGAWARRRVDALRSGPHKKPLGGRTFQWVLRSATRRFRRGGSSDGPQP